MKQITLEDVEKFLGADEYAAEEGKELAYEAELDVRSTVGRIYDLRTGVGVNLERDRVLKLWHVFHTSMRDMDLANALRTIGQAQQASLQLGYAIATGLDCNATDSVDVSGGTDDANQKSNLNKNLLTGIVKLMSKAGTLRDGAKAQWTFSEIVYGISVATPDAGEDLLGEAMKYLTDQRVVYRKQLGKCISSVYVLTDDYKKMMESLGLEVGEPAVTKIDERQEMIKDLREILQSNRDIGGKLLPWSMNSLVFALRDKYKWIHSDDIEAAVLEIEECRQLGDKMYLWTMDTAIPVDAVFAPVVSEKPVGVVKAADAIFAVMKNDLECGVARIWKEYDISGLVGRGSEFGGKLKDEYLKPDVMMAALNLLVVEKKLEVILPSDERPWLKKPGWRVVR